MRAFLALALPAEVRRALAEAQEALRAADADVTWVNPEQLHLTLKFLGDVTDAQRAAIDEGMRQVAAAHRRFTARAQALGAFPPGRAPRIVWAGVHDPGRAMCGLAGAIEAQAEAAGVPREARGFSPHVTLGRVRSPRGVEDLVRAIRSASWPGSSSWTVTAVTLFQSVLDARGARYTMLAEHPLAGGEPAA